MTDHDVINDPASIPFKYLLFMSFQRKKENGIKELTPKSQSCNPVRSVYGLLKLGIHLFLKEKISFLSNLIIYVVYLGHVAVLRRKANIISAFLPILERRRFPHETKDKRLLRDKGSSRFLLSVNTLKGEQQKDDHKLQT